MSPALKSTGGRGVDHFGPKFPGVPLGVNPMFGSAQSEHPRLTSGEIISEEFQPK